MQKMLLSLALVGALSACQRAETPAPVATTTPPPAAEQPVAAATVAPAVVATVAPPSVAAVASDASQLPDVGTEEKLPQLPEDIPPVDDPKHSLSEGKDTEPGNP